ncbi:MAG: signal transduction histidine kinase [Phycisphaerales bacterium]|jgi:signal transduction histidine kinase
MRIRKKLMFLHTLFSIVLAVVLVLALHPAITNIVLQAQTQRLTDVLKIADAQGRLPDASALESLGITLFVLVEEIRWPESSGIVIPPSQAVVVERSLDSIEVRYVLAASGEEVLAVLRSGDARRALRDITLLIILAVLGVYAIVAASLELFVLPRHVYGPLRAALRADEAVRTGNRSGELIPAEMMPADELGAIMRSRNQSVSALRAGEAQLADTLDRLESVATDLKRKNHLLENARKNLEGADRLRSLGMMSAGIAHEINTPLAVAKGLVEKLESQRSLSESESALLGRVITRLESLSDSLLDFARARSLEPKACRLATLAEEAASLVRLDRNTMPPSPSGGIRLVNAVPDTLTLECEPDRIIQVLVNLTRNGVNAIRGATSDSGAVTLDAQTTDRDGQRWVQITVTDTGPGIDPEILPSLFEPFVSTRLDARGTGLGLAVAEGIVREHGGTVIARNRPDRAGAIFEVMLPQEAATLGDQREAT